jgi:hypothetical protein
MLVPGKTASEIPERVKCPSGLFLKKKIELQRDVGAASS